MHGFKDSAQELHLNGTPGAGIDRSKKRYESVHLTPTLDYIADVRQTMNGLPGEPVLPHASATRKQSTATHLSPSTGAISVGGF